MRTTDELVGSFVEHLKSTGRWEDSVVMILADHSMDWSYSHRVISLGAPIWFDPVLHGKVVLDQRGVLSVHTPQELRLGDRVGDLVAYCEEGWRFSDPTIVNNPIPGNHGHPVTEPIPFIIAGGHRAIRPGVRGEVAHTVDVAPTVGRLLGLPSLSGGYDGVDRL